uniref:23S rRNA pseudouridine synthase D,PilA n=1 Tax=Haemophilus influenzae TaxID=727 RepID=UPI0010FFCD50|nr:Chain A, 23S rRNA pseudouridine synthase D,PilA [Haemophilus influenzae]6GUT_B Chain B, 23S rRNA pseudouridine synthase D,PilA [Haemophilus influenzae]
QIQKAEQNDVKLAPPTDVRSGYIRLVKNVNYYIDSESIWVDNQEPQIVHFDAVVNLDKGLYVYPEPKRYARSVRQYKILNCANYHLTQVRTDFYDEFWGQGLRAAPKKQKKHTLSLTPDTTLYNAAQIICANYGEAFSVDKKGGTKKAAVSELLQASAPYKADVELCVYSTNETTNCTGGKNGIAADITTAKGYVKSVTTSNGAITVKGDGTLANMEYILQATGNAATGVTWTTTCKGTDASLFPANFCGSVTQGGHHHHHH